MLYNYSFEIAAIVFLIIILFDMLQKKRITDSKGKFFAYYIVTAIFYVSFNISSSIAIEKAEFVLPAINYTLAYGFFFVQAAVGLVFFSYFLLEVNYFESLNITKKIILFISLVPVIVYSVLLIINPLTPTFFSFTSEMVYKQGATGWYGYFYVFIYFFFELIILIMDRKKEEYRVFKVIMFYTVLDIIAIVLQFFVFPNILLTGIAHAVSTFYIYLAFQNPNRHIDPVTNCLNSEALEQTISKFSKDKIYHLVYINPDRFRYINKILGYDVGNEILHSICSYVQNKLKYKKVYKIKSDYLFILLDDDENPLDLIENLKKRFDSPWHTGAGDVSVTASFSCVNYPFHFTDYTNLLSLTGYINNYTHNLGGNRIVNINDKVLKEYKRNQAVVEIVSDSIRNKSFDIYIQPIIDIKTNNVYAGEVLVRINDPKIGLIYPDEFIPACEKNGQINLIGVIVFEKACEFIEKNMNLFGEDKMKYLNVNISIIECSQNSFSEKFLSIMKSHNVDPKYINLEITEMSKSTTEDVIVSNMNELIGKGVTFSLDDYGTGNSNLSYLINYPFSTVKFDKTMTWSCLKDKKADSLINSQIDAVKKLGFKVVFEGVETKEQRDTLKKSKADFFQGYLYSKPIPAEDFIKYYSNYNNKE